jgi:hypothetical protein
MSGKIWAPFVSAEANFAKPKVQAVSLRVSRFDLFDFPGFSYIHPATSNSRHRARIYRVLVLKHLNMTFPKMTQETMYDFK